MKAEKIIRKHLASLSILAVVFTALALSINSLHAQRIATGSAHVINGFVIGVTIIDGGDGYETAPAVWLVGGGGSGALAYAGLSHKAVGGITVTNAGFGYTNAPSLLIDPPPPAPVIDSVSQNGTLICTNLQPGTTARVEWASSLLGPWTNTWTGLGAVTADSNGMTQVSVPIFYRVRGMGWTNPVAPPFPAPSNMVFIPAASFPMGESLFGESDAEILHTVYVSAFYMDRYEVTKELWDEVYAWAISHGYSFDSTGLGKAPTHPAHSMNWYDAGKWCNARSEKAGLTPAYYTSAEKTTVYRSGTNVENAWVKWNAGYRLPTEAEWEKAARGGASGYRFPWSDTDNITHSRANYVSSTDYPYDTSFTRGHHPTFDDGAPPYTSPAGYFPPNGYGLYDMTGNVWEWCWDWYGSYSSASQTDPRGPSSGTFRMVRGGSWGDDAYFCRKAYRNYDNPTYRSYGVGFRSVLPSGQ